MKHRRSIGRYRGEFVSLDDPETFDEALKQAILCRVYRDSRQSPDGVADLSAIAEDFASKFGGELIGRVLSEMKDAGDLELHPGSQRIEAEAIISPDQIEDVPDDDADDSPDAA